MLCHLRAGLIALVSPALNGVAWQKLFKFIDLPQFLCVRSAR